MEEPFEDLKKIEKRIHELEQEMAVTNDLDTIMNQYDSLLSKFQDEGGYAMESQVKGVLNGLGFDEDMWYFIWLTEDKNCVRSVVITFS